MKFSKLILWLTEGSFAFTQNVQNNKWVSSASKNNQAVENVSSGQTIDATIAFNNSNDDINNTELMEDCINFSKFMDQFFINNSSSFKCCDNSSIVCIGGNIASIDIDFSNYNSFKPEFTNFPILSKLRNLKIKHLYGAYDSSNYLPEIFFLQPSLETLNITDSNIEVLPKNFNKT
jgi:hypothetical protein